jgi:hypothetical protein
MPRISASSSQEPLLFQQVSQLQAQVEAQQVQMRQMQAAHDKEIA